MLKRELKINFKSFIIWTSILVLLLLCGYLIYPTIVQSNEVNLNELMKTMPEEILRMFNMDLYGLETVYSWIKSEGYTFLLIIGGLFACLTGGNILLKEESERTIEYLAVKPVTRTKIVIDKLLCGLFYIIIMFMILFVVNLIGLLCSCDFEYKELILMSVAPLLSIIPLYLISMFISTFFNKTKKVTGINMGVVFLSYFLMVFSNMTDKVSFLKYFSVFTLADLRPITENGSISLIKIVVFILISLLTTWLIIRRYNKKEFL